MSGWSSLPGHTMHWMPLPARRSSAQATHSSTVRRISRLKTSSSFSGWVEYSWTSSWLMATG